LVWLVWFGLVWFVCLFGLFVNLLVCLFLLTYLPPVFDKSSKLLSLASSEGDSCIKAINFNGLSTEKLSISQLKKIHEEAKSIGNQPVCYV
jgi:hypothetical protein